jgi:hypothetical protein
VKRGRHQIAAIDAWIALQGAKISRPEAISAVWSSSGPEGEGEMNNSILTKLIVTVVVLIALWVGLTFHRTVASIVRPTFHQAEGNQKRHPRNDFVRLLLPSTAG